MATRQEIRDNHDKEVSRLANRTLASIKDILGNGEDLVSSIDQIKGVLLMYDSERLDIMNRYLSELENISDFESADAAIDYTPHIYNINE